MANQGDTKPPAPRPRRPLTDLRREPDSAALKAAGVYIPPAPKVPSFDEPQSEPAPVAPKRSVFSLRVTGLRELATFIGLLASIGLGVWNKVDKADDKQVEQVAQKTETTKKAIDGDPLASARRDEQGLTKRVDALEWHRGADERFRCAWQRWQAEAMKLQKPPVFVTVEGCETEPAEPFEYKRGPSMPNGRIDQIVVTTPVPKR